MPPRLPLTRFIGEVKGNSSHFVNHVIRPDYPFAWQNEYGVISFEEHQLTRFVRYVRNQAIHHAEGTFIPTLEHASEPTD